MIKKFFLIGCAIVLFGCKKESNDTSKTIAKFSPEVEENGVIYEVNIRQYSPEGSFNAFTKDIPQLKELGVKIIWVMPIFPISQTKRKASGEFFSHYLVSCTFA
jgi:pullulanase/glycogen debranching enzyme